MSWSTAPINPEGDDVAQVSQGIVGILLEVTAASCFIIVSETHAAYGDEDEEHVGPRNCLRRFMSVVFSLGPTCEPHQVISGIPKKAFTKSPVSSYGDVVGRTYSRCPCAEEHRPP